MNKDYIQEYFDKYNGSIYKKSEFKREILPYIDKNIPEMIINESPKTKLYWFLNDLNDYPECQASSCNNKVTVIPGGKFSYGKCCSSRCSGIYTSENRSKETLLKIGRKSAEANKNRSEEEKEETKKKKQKSWSSKDRTYVSEKRKKTCMQRYGVDNISKLEGTKEKSKKTKKDRYGNENYNNKEKEKATKLEKYGNENYNNKEKISKTNKIVWGSGTTLRVEQMSSFDRDLAYLSHKETILNKYGVENISQIPEVQDKKLKSSFKKKIFISPSGKEIFYQGYENLLLRELFSKYNEDDIITGIDIPNFWYIGEDNKRHKYFPDVYVKSTNTVYEVKSEYTMNADFQKNLRKFSAVQESTYNFKLKIY